MNDLWAVGKILVIMVVVALVVLSILDEMGVL